MITLILLALLLTFIQLMTPAILNVKNLEFLISNREGSVDEAPVVGRARRAGSNILESRPLLLYLHIWNSLSANNSMDSFYFLSIFHGCCFVVSL